MNSTSTPLPTPEGPSAGHLLAEQAPEELLTAPTEILAPYCEGGGDSQ